MRKLIVFGAVFALMGGAAMAQDYGGGPGNAGGKHYQHRQMGPGAGSGWKGRYHHRWLPMRPGMQRPGGPGGGMGPGGMGPRFMMPSKGASFEIVLSRRGSRVKVKCAEADTTQACADAVSGMVEKIAPALRPAPRMAPPAGGGGAGGGNNNDDN